MRPLRLAFLWHFHQPDYRVDTHLRLPWVRYHAVKDYAWLPATLHAAGIRSTINIVPSLLDQLEAYEKGAVDPWFVHVAPAEWTSEERQAIISRHIVLSSHMMHITTWHSTLIETAHSAPESLSTDDIIDLVVLYNLAWTSPSLRRENSTVRSLMSKERGFLWTDLEAIQHITRRACADVVPAIQRYATSAGSVSTTPYHHPILPLLINSDVAREAVTTMEVPHPAITFADDAEQHVRRAISRHTDLFATPPVGMWPAEGSISNDAADMFARCGLQWIASDEVVLRNSLGENVWPTAAMYPWRVPTKSGEVTLFARDRELSDAIGFSYADRDPKRAAEDFVRLLEERRRAILAHDGEEALDDAVISIILDGENCWEFYRNNGEDFLLALGENLSKGAYELVTFDDVVQEQRRHTLPNIVAGSWIDGTFGVWIGSPTKNLAWSLLRRARQAVRDSGHETEFDVDRILGTEASDWFWWYDERHVAPNSSEFDDLFRSRLRAMFAEAAVDVPLECTLPLPQQTTTMTSDSVHRIAVTFGSAAMHTADPLIRYVTLESSEGWQRIGFELARLPVGNEQITIVVTSTDDLERTVRINADGGQWWTPLHDEGSEWRNPHTFAIYVHNAHLWRLAIEEERADGAIRVSSLAITP